MRTAIITGANGFVGHYLVKLLADQGYRVLAVVRNEKEAFQNISAVKNVHIVFCDLNQIASLYEKIECNVSESVFYHLAWAGNSGSARGDYQLQMDNARYAVDAAVQAQKLGCRRFVVSGSVTQLMYRDYLRQDRVSLEQSACYAVGKMAAEALLKCMCHSIGIELCWAYIANFYGPDDPTENFINFLIGKYKAREVPALTPAEQLADFMYVTDVARALFFLGERGKADCAYYVGYGHPRPLKEFVNLIYNKIDPGTASGIGTKKFCGSDMQDIKTDYQKLYRDTGFKPKVSFEEGIEILLDLRGNKKERES